AIARAVDPIDGVSGLDEIVHPSGSSADAHHVRALAAASVDHHDRIAMAALGRDHVLHEHLAQRDLAVGHLLALDSDPEAALVGDFDRGRFTIRMGVGGGLSSEPVSESGVEPVQNRPQDFAIVALEHRHPAIAPYGMLFGKLDLFDLKA